MKINPKDLIVESGIAIYNRVPVKDPMMEFIAGLKNGDSFEVPDYATSELIRKKFHKLGRSATTRKSGPVTYRIWAGAYIKKQVVTDPVRLQKLRANIQKARDARAAKRTEWTPIPDNVAEVMRTAVGGAQ